MEYFTRFTQNSKDILIMSISSTSARHKARSRMRCDEAPIMKVCDLQGCLPTTPDAPSQDWWNEMKRNEWDECREIVHEIYGRDKRGKHLERPTKSPFRPQGNPHGVTETRTREPSCERRESNRLHHQPPFDNVTERNMFPCTFDKFRSMIQC